MEMWMNSIAGLFVGMMIGATGVGGGAVMTPLLILIMGVAPHTAVGTDLLYASFTKMVGVGVHHSANRVDWQVVRRLAMGSLPAALTTLLWMKMANSSGVKEGVIIFALGMVLIATSIAMILNPYLFKLGKNLRIGDPTHFKQFQFPLTIAAGALLGFLVALTSIGAGSLGAPILLALYPLRLTPARLVATDLAHAIPLALVAGIGHVLMGNVDFALLGWLLLGSVPGVLIGAHFGGKLPDRVLQIAIAIVLTFVGLKLLR
jgi:uncharacterized protein